MLLVATTLAACATTDQLDKTFQRTYVSPSAQVPLVEAAIPPAPPIHIEVQGEGGVYISSGVEPLEAVNGNALPRDLPGWWKWRDDVTTYPGTQTQTSVWIFGHAQSSPSMVFNPLMTTVVGDRVVLTTSAGKLAYQVQDEPFLVLKDQMSNRKDVFTSHPGRLVLVTCNVEGGQDTLYNRVVFAQLM